MISYLVLSVLNLKVKSKNYTSAFLPCNYNSENIEFLLFYQKNIPPSRAYPLAFLWGGIGDPSQHHIILE